MSYKLDPASPHNHVGLYCVHHPDLRWSTKNIAPIGCRKIFYNLYGVPDAPVECDCPASDLRVLSTKP